MALNELLKKEIEKKLITRTHKTLKITDALPVHGGDTHGGLELKTTAGTFFLKESSHPSASDLFKKEYNGLQLVKEQNAIAVAEPFFYGKAEGYSFLVMEFISKAHADASFWEKFAQGLAALHRSTQENFGLKEDNYIGLLPQPNKEHDNWTDFYISQRLQPLIRKGIDQKLFVPSVMDNAVRLYNRLPELFPDESPALLHGDLWGGNYLCGAGGKPWLFDPAVYYGLREMDLAMARLFGGFDRRFFWHYENIFPLSEGWQKRIPLCQLYPLLVHSLLFGGGYVQQARRIIEEYGG